MKLSIILGTMPKIINLAPIVKELEKRNLKFFILHAGQHYSYNMERVLGRLKAVFNRDAFWGFIDTMKDLEEVEKILARE